MNLRRSGYGRGMRLLLLGAPGSGKGTQAARLAKALGVEHIASGELLRAQVRAGTALGATAREYLDRGDLVPDPLVIDMLLPVLERSGAAGGYVLDGFPRTVEQAAAAGGMATERGVAAQLAVHLRASEAELLERLLRRAVELDRSDDAEPTIRHRLAVFAKQTAPLLHYYADRGILLEVDAMRPVEEVTAQILRGVARSDGDDAGGGRGEQ